MASRTSYPDTFLRLNAHTGRQTYTVGNVAVNRRHLGQRKLCLSEVHFLTMYAKTGCVVVYAGAADGRHIPLLVHMFPEVAMWYLYDPLDCDTRGTRSWNRNVIEMADARRDMFHVVTGYFTDTCAAELRMKHPNDMMLFISDVRSDARDDDAIVRDMAMQRKWVDIMQPERSVMKFRLPYPQWDSATRTCVNPTFSYVKGVVMVGVFAPKNSTEGRILLKKGVTEEVVWDVVDVEERFAHFNRVARETGNFDNWAQWRILMEYATTRRQPIEDVAHMFDAVLSDKFTTVTQGFKMPDGGRLFVEGAAALQAMDPMRLEVGTPMMESMKATMRPLASFEVAVRAYSKQPNAKSADRMFEACGVLVAGLRVLRHADQAEFDATVCKTVLTRLENIINLKIVEANTIPLASDSAVALRAYFKTKGVPGA